MKAGKTDFTVAKAGAADMIVSFLKKDQVDKISYVEGVKNVTPYVMTIVSSGNNPYFIIGGFDPSKIDIVGGKIIEGRVYQNDNEIVIGKITQRNRNLNVGDTLILNNKSYSIVGVFESGVSLQDGGAITTIRESQRLQGIRDQYNMAMVQVEEGYEVRDVADRVEKVSDEFISIVDLNDLGAIDQSTKLINALSWGISLLAIIIGGIGVMNTIIMSVFERTREIGVLKALGWRRRRILMMILTESLLLGIVAAIIGILVGIGLVLLIVQTEMGQTWLQVKYEPAIFVRALIVSLAVVSVGAIYPAFKASRLHPTEALRYE
jgi:putative ABC transport system permease protein